MLLVAAALSILMGLALGLLGGGGSILTVPILLYVVGLPTKTAIATSLLVVGLTSLTGVIQHGRVGNVRWGTGLVFGGVAMVGAYLGGRAAAFVPGPVLLIIFASLMVVTAVGMLRPKKGGDAEPVEKAFSFPKIAAQGLVVGALTGLVGAGGGFLIVPALVFLAGLSMHEAVGTSLLVITMNSGAGIAGQLAHVHLDLRVAAIVAAAAVVGSVVGTTLARRVPQAALRRIFAWFVLAMAGFILYRQAPAGMVASILATPWVPWVLAAVGLAVVTLLILLRFRRPGDDLPNES